ncbi:hypothetical protein HDU84_007599 [Entophlyctis sp. JEL0112]|nr:hypothetical protein HDU84_007599 [Entophlyctis sp. JEL0112]
MSSKSILTASTPRDDRNGQLFCPSAATTQPTHRAEPKRTDTIDDGDVEILDAEPRSILLALISQLTIGMDLHKYHKLLYRPSCWRRVPCANGWQTFLVIQKLSWSELAHSVAFDVNTTVRIPRLHDPVDRFLAATRFFLSGWHIRPKGVKKPYNPVLGEFFRCTWTLHDGSQSIYVCEQVSHHPPVSAFAYINLHHHIEITGQLAPKPRFLGNSVATLMHGETRVRVRLARAGGTGSGGDDGDGDSPVWEEYSMTFPNVYARGILFGTMYTEVGDVATVACARTRLSASLEFRTREVFSDRLLDAVDGAVVRRGEGAGGETVVARICGRWSGQVLVERVRDETAGVVASCTTKRRSRSPIFPTAPLQQTFAYFDRVFINTGEAVSSSTSVASKTVLFDATDAKIAEKIVLPESAMESFESRK